MWPLAFLWNEMALCGNTATVSCPLLLVWALLDLAGTLQDRNNCEEIASTIKKSQFPSLTVISFPCLWRLDGNREAQAYKSMHLGASLQTLLLWHTVLNWLNKDKGIKKIQYFSCSPERRTMPAVQDCAARRTLGVNVESIYKTFTFKSQ